MQESQQVRTVSRKQYKWTVTFSEGGRRATFNEIGRAFTPVVTVEIPPHAQSDNGRDLSTFLNTVARCIVANYELQHRSIAFGIRYLPGIELTPKERAAGYGLPERVSKYGSEPATPAAKRSSRR